MLNFRNIGILYFFKTIETHFFRAQTSYILIDRSVWPLVPFCPTEKLRKQFFLNFQNQKISYKWPSKLENLLKFSSKPIFGPENTQYLLYFDFIPVLHFVEGWLPGLLILYCSAWSKSKEPVWFWKKTGYSRKAEAWIFWET